MGEKSERKGDLEQANDTPIDNDNRQVVLKDRNCTPHAQMQLGFSCSFAVYPVYCGITMRRNHFMSNVHNHDREISSVFDHANRTRDDRTF
jgi:hypothetical protein